VVIGYHLIITAYGFWLPNDPRGSWSEFVGAWGLYRFGGATKTDCRQSVASKPHDRQTRLAAKRTLKYPDVHFTGLQARAIGRGFADYVRRSGLTVWACSILPEHVHFVVARHRYEVEQVANLLKGAATRLMVEQGLHPFGEHSSDNDRVPTVWARRHWKVFLYTEQEVERAIKYVDRNPLKEGKLKQHWSFVVPFKSTWSSTRSPSGRG
jgi:REP element-mobilizing transposase RayT